MARQKLSISFGGGVDRKSGVGVVDPDAFYDLRNVYLYKGRTILRKGMARVLDIGWGSDIIGIFSVRAQGLAAIIVYDDESGDVRLYLVDGTLETASLVGTVWSGISAAATTPPIVSGDDLYNKLVLAHSEPVFAQRQATRVFDVNTFTLSDLESDLDRDTTAETVKFFAVKKHLNCLVGVGYGTGADEDSPHTARISKPGEPTTFIPESYFQVGSPGDPILDMVKSGNYLEFLKTKETHFLVGNGPKTYDVVPGDDSFGVLNAKLAVTVVDTAYRWSLDGPRVSRGGASEDLELPLNLAGPLPDPIADESEGFAYHDAKENEVVFVFGPWAYVLHLKDGKRRWSYREYGVWLQSAGRIYEGGSASLSLAEAVIGTIALDVPVYTGDPVPSIVVPWTITGSLIGGEEVEVWGKSSYTGDIWTLLATVPATDLTAPAELYRWLTDYEIAVRVTLSGVPGAGYTASDASLWPAAARDTINSGGEIESVTIGDWDRLSSTRPTRKLEFVGAGMGVDPHPELTFLLEADTGGGYAAVLNAPFATPADIRDERVNGSVNTVSTTYRLSAVGPDATSPTTINTEGARVFEPKLTSVPTSSGDLGGFGGGHIHHVHATSFEPAGTVEVRGRHQPAGAYAGYFDDAGAGVDLNVVGGAGLGTPGVDDGDFEFDARCYIVAFTVTDRSATSSDVVSPDP